MRSSLLTLLFLCGCYDFIDVWDVYEIPQGKHYSRRVVSSAIPNFTKKTTLSFKAYFWDNCLYSGNDAINKLYGVTICAASTVHKNSARFGWRGNKGVIEIYAYWYIDGVRGWYKMGETLVWQQNNYQIVIKDHEIAYTFDGNTHIVPRNDCSDILLVRLFPYFGGTQKAPQTMKISILEHESSI